MSNVFYAPICYYISSINVRGWSEDVNTVDKIVVKTEIGHVSARKKGSTTTTMLMIREETVGCDFRERESKLFNNNNNNERKQNLLLYYHII